MEFSDNANLIKSQLELVGNRIVLSDGDWQSMPFYAVINHLWRRKSSRFEPLPEQVGRVSNEYYIYIGPHNHNILSLSDDACVEYNGSTFEFKRRDAVKSGDTVLYYTGILKKLEEVDYDEM